MEILNGYGKEYIGQKAYKPKGCPKCFNTGYFGREAVFEIMMIDDTLKNLMFKTSDANKVRAAALTSGMRTLKQDGMAKVIQGITSIREVLRVV